MKKNTPIYWLLSLAGMIAVFLWMRNQGAPLTRPFTPNGILNLEFAWEATRAAEIKNAWWNIIPVAKMNIYIDFLFIITYTLFLKLCCEWISGRFSGKWGLWGQRLARMVPGAAVFDVAENALMLLTLDNRPNDYTVMVTMIFALFKFAIALVAVLYILASIPVSFVKRK